MANVLIKLWKTIDIDWTWNKRIKIELKQNQL